MNKLVIVIFGLLTVGSVFLSVRHVGVTSPNIETPSVRFGSSHSGGGFWVGGGSRTK